MERSLRVAAPPSVAVDAILKVIRGRLAGSSRVHHMPGIPPRVLHEAVSRYGVGLDHEGGEVPVALIGGGLDDGRVPLRGYRAGYLVTDRRVFGRVDASNGPGMFTDVPYARVVGVPGRVGGLAPSTIVYLSDGPRRLYLLPKHWHAFFAEMVATIPAEQRTLGPIPRLRRSAPDPTGALFALHIVRAADARTWVPLRALYEAQRRGIIEADDGAELVLDMMMLARGVVAGRGSVWAGWRSVLPQPVLVHALQAVLGAPTAANPGRDGEVLDYLTGSTPGSATDTAVVRGAAGAPMRAMAGLGCISVGEVERLACIRVRVADHGAGSAFQLFGSAGFNWEPLSVRWWRSVDAIHQALFRMEARYLLGQALFGTGQPFDYLLAQPRDVLESAAAELLGPTDLALFFPS